MNSLILLGESVRVILFVFIKQRFAAVIMRIREPRTTALIFSSGKMVCTGAKRYIFIIYIIVKIPLYTLFSTV